MLLCLTHALLAHQWVVEMGGAHAVARTIRADAAKTPMSDRLTELLNKAPLVKKVRRQEQREAKAAKHRAGC